MAGNPKNLIEFKIVSSPSLVTSSWAPSTAYTATTSLKAIRKSTPNMLSTTPTISTSIPANQGKVTGLEMIGVQCHL